MADTVKQIKSRLNLSDVIGGYLKLQKTGANFKARCPFHNEKTPSFHINTERQIWHCFGCSKGGDIFSFIQDIEGIDFPEALRILGARAGVEIEKLNPQQREKRSRRGVLLRANALAQAFFSKQLWQSDAGSRAMKYLRDRGMTDETIKAWEIGWAPNDWQALTPFLRTQDLTDEDIVASGLASARDRRLYDRFRGRIVFPINDHNGQVLGFAGRIFGRDENDREPKYLNSPQTQLYDKGHVLFGLDKARIAIRDTDSCVLVEGNTDVIMAWQAGVVGAVATSGTAMTPEQVRLLGRYTKNLRFCFDTDQAGAAATRRGIALAMSAGMDVRITQLDDPECKDPADYVLKHGTKFAEVVASSKPAIEHYLEHASEQYDASSPQSKKAVLAAVGPFVKRLTSRVEATHWISQLAALLRSSPEDIRADVQGLKDDFDSYRAVEPPSKESGPVKGRVEDDADPLEQALLSLLMRDLSHFQPKLGDVDRAWISPQLGVLVDEFAAIDISKHEWDAFLKDHEDGSWQLEFAYIRAQEQWDESSGQEMDRQWRIVVSRLGQRYLKDKARQMEREIKVAEDTRDEPKLKTLLADFSQLRQDISRLLRL